MSYDENSVESPLEGTGEEMVPERGLPFEDVDDPLEGLLAQLDDMTDDQARELTPDELTEIVGGVEGTEDFITTVEAAREVAAKVAGRGADPAAGMGAAEPVMTDGELEALFAEAAEATPAGPGAIGHFQTGGIEIEDPSDSFAVDRDEERGKSKGLEAGEDMLKMFVTEKRLNELWERADQARVDVRNMIPSLDMARALLDQIEYARNELMVSPDRYEEAERAINEVEMRISIVQRSQREAPDAMKLFFYEVAWGALLLLSLLGFLPNMLSFVEGAYVYLLMSAVVGAFGGITGALYSLWKHVSKEMDFSKQFTIWYIVNPIMGFILGGFVYGVVQAGFISLQTGDTSAEITSVPYIILVLAFIVGFQQNVAWELMRRVIKTLFPEDSSAASTGVSDFSRPPSAGK